MSVPIPIPIPIVIICYNNYKYVDNTVNQILQINKEYFNAILIVDNCSTCEKTINYLKKSTCKVIFNEKNNGPWINTDTNTHVYNILPDKFILTDPDLELNKNIPNNFIEILSLLSDKYDCKKIGLALDISDFDKMYHDILLFGQNIYVWEIRHWYNKIANDYYELYNAEIDTTFCLINKKSSSTLNIRVAGNFTTKHLPWYIDNKVYNVYDNYIMSTQTNQQISNIAKVILPYIERTYVKIHKNDELFFIQNKEDDMNLDFWKNNYPTCEKESFTIFDKYLNKDKVFIDIGGWIGATTMYGARKSKHVYSIEADQKSLLDVRNNCKNNCDNNYTIIHSAIYNLDNIIVKFGKNLFLHDSKMNDGNSHIYLDEETSNDYHMIKTVTIINLLATYNINPYEISLINVDIEGGEEHILYDLYNIHKLFNIPVYISFHYDWWKDKNLERFVFLSETQRENIITDPFTKILFG